MRVLLIPGGMRPEPGGTPLVAPGLGLPAREAGAALARGWASRRPDDVLDVRPLPDGGPGTVQDLPADRVRSRTVLHARSPLGEVREIDLVSLRPSGAPAAGSPSTWYLDAARLMALPADRDEAAREAREGTTAGLGEVVAEALRRTEPGDTLVIGLSRSSVDDGGAGALEALGGIEPARRLLDGRAIVLALADDSPLGGMSGVGASLARIAALPAEEAQAIDRAACSAASVIVSQLDRPRPGALPLSGPGTAREPLGPSSWGSGAAGGAALVLRALGAGAVPGTRALERLLGLEDAAPGHDLVVTTTGEAYDVLADSVAAVAGGLAAAEALPAVLVGGRIVVPRGELAEAGIVSAYSLEESGEDWLAGGSDALIARLEDMGSRLARTWSR